MAAQQVIAVIGGGSFGTAIANIATEKGHLAHLWMRSTEQVAEIRRTGMNARYLPGCQLNKGVSATSDLAEAVADASIIFVSIPSKSLREVVSSMAPLLREDQLLISTTKGIEADGFKLMSQVLLEETRSANIGVLSGPNLAKEIALRQPTATVIASSSPKVRKTIQEVLHCDYFRVYASADMFGVELGGALKNIYAIASGLVHAMGMGENTKAMLITRSLAEMSRFAVHLGANPMTFLGLAGVGDLVVTCMSPLIRNFRVGYALGQGQNLEEAVDELGEVAEGVNTLRLVRQQSRDMDIYMPLVDSLHAVLFENVPIPEALHGLMTNEQSSDVEFVLPR